jgi:hypothetical protein
VGPWDYAHRVAWTLVNGEIPDGVQIISHCRVRLCVRPDPDHRLPKTPAEFGQYKAEHGIAARGERTRPERRVRGERHHQAKLSDAQVAEIRRRYAAGGTTITRLADDFGITASHVWQIVTKQIRKS